jgi:hypothetical protein
VASAFLHQEREKDFLCSAIFLTFPFSWTFVSFIEYDSDNKA